MQAHLLTLVQKVKIIANKELELRNAIAEVDTLYNGAPNWDEALTQAEIDTVPAFEAVGLTPQQIADVIYAAKQADAQIAGNLPSMFVLANI
jgi:hypothetical protein